MYDTNLDEKALGGEYPWSAYIRAVQGHSGADPDLMDRVEYTEETGEFLYHVGYEKDHQSIAANGLTPGWTGTRTENNLSAGHPKLGGSADPGQKLPVKATYRTKKRATLMHYIHIVSVLCGGLACS